MGVNLEHLLGLVQRDMSRETIGDVAKTNE
jgi:hypothetical protein